MLSQEESILWNSFPNCENSYILTGDSHCLLDFNSYQTSGYLIEEEFEIEERHQPSILAAEENLHFEPDTLSRDLIYSDNPDSQPFIQPYLIGSEESLSKSLLPFQSKISHCQPNPYRENRRRT